jgi:hypothetical protein
MDKIYIDNSKRATAIEVPEYGEIKLIVKEGKVVHYDVVSSHKVSEKE